MMGCLNIDELCKKLHKDLALINYKRMTTVLGGFNNLLIRFFEDLSESFPEERDIKSALEMIKFAKASTPKIILVLYYEHVYKGINEAVKNEDANYIIDYANKKISTEFNEISPALTIFNKHWHTMSDTNKKAIWEYLRRLNKLVEIYYSNN